MAARIWAVVWRIALAAILAALGISALALMPLCFASIQSLGAITFVSSVLAMTLLLGAVLAVCAGLALLYMAAGMVVWAASGAFE